MSWQAVAIGWMCKALILPALSRSALPEPSRSRLERLARLCFRLPPLSLVQSAQVGGIPGLWVQNRPRRDAVMLYLHGGGYAMGSPETHQAALAALAARTGMRAFLPDYRLAPEHPFPAAFDDALAAWQGLMALGYRPDQVILGGDSAGGGLALAVLARLCEGGQRPAGLFAFSPWTDLTLTGASLVTNAARERLLPAHRLTQIRAMILGGARPGEANDPRLSPFHASFPAPPPVQIHVAESEILRDDALRMRGRLPKAEIRLAGDLPHAWPLMHSLLPEARQTLDDTAQFILACLHQGSNEN